MGRRAKPPKEKVDAIRARACKSPRNDDSNGRDLEKRLTEALKREVEARERQTATGEILRVISSSPTDVQPVFAAIVDAAGRLCGAESAIVYRFAGDQVQFAASYNFPGETVEMYRRRFPRPLGEE